MTDITEAPTPEGAQERAQDGSEPEGAKQVPGTHDHIHLGWELALISVAQLMVVLDATIVNIALPSA